VPVLLTLIAWLVLFSRSPRSDHFFDTFSIPYACDPKNLPQHPNQCAPNPAEVLAFPADGKVVVVAASGGGIQASAWTARVLTGLEQQNSGKFARAVRLISSVSGGSVGAMYFSSRYQPNGGLANLPDIVADAKASSLEDVSWGLAYPDLLRVLAPLLFWKLGGRGRALERAWMHTAELQKLLAAKLSDWFAGVRAGTRPANIFNATITETGDRLLFSTTYLPVGTPPTPPARWDFHELYLNDPKMHTLDVAVVTAARMSATFPYVTPASRPDAGGPQTPQLHVVDGGYFDNYGMDTLLEWLDDGLMELEQNPAAKERFAKLKVMIVEIHEAPDPHRLVPPKVRQKRSWFFQTYAPLVTLFSVRTAGQRSHNQVDLELMKQKWAGKLEHVLFEFGTHDPTARVEPDELKDALLKDPAPQRARKRCSWEPKRLPFRTRKSWSRRWTLRSRGI
jgi:Patatin-like phospholipase